MSRGLPRIPSAAIFFFVNGFRRIIKWLTVLTFVLEVLNPSTAFVREQVNPNPKQKYSKIEKRTAQEQATPLEAATPEAPDEDEFLTCSATLPQEAFPPQLYGTQESIEIVDAGAARMLVGSIQRPPSRG